MTHFIKGLFIIAIIFGSIHGLSMWIANLRKIKVNNFDDKFDAFILTFLGLFILFLCGAIVYLVGGGK